MDARPYAASDRAAWNSFNAAARNGHFMFDRGFMEYHADRFADASLTIWDEGRVVGLVAANRDEDTIHSHQGLTFGGLISETLGVAVTLRVMEACAEVWRGMGARSLVYKPVPWIYHRRPAQEDLYWLFRRDAQLVRRDVTTVIDLQAPGRRSSRRERGVRKAVRAGLIFGRSDRWRDFWEVLCGVLAARHGATPTHRLEEIERLAAAFPESISLHIAERDGELLAGVVMFVGPQVAHAQYIATSDAGRSEGALDGLFDHLITVHRASRFFDFGISNTDQGRVLNEGLAGQKEEFGGSAAVHDVYRLEGL